MCIIDSRLASSSKGYVLLRPILVLLKGCLVGSPGYRERGMLRVAAPSVPTDGTHSALRACVSSRFYTVAVADVQMEQRVCRRRARLE